MQRDAAGILANGGVAPRRLGRIEQLTAVSMAWTDPGELRQD